MPPVAGPGSRAPLITTIVILAILFITSTIFAFYFWSVSNKLTMESEALQKEFSVVVTKQALAAQDVADLKSARSAEGQGFTPSMSLLDVAIAQRNRLARSITGAPTTAADAQQRTAAGIDTAQKRLAGEKVTGVSLPQDNLLGAIDALTTAVLARESEVTELKRNLQAANDEVKATVERTKGELEAKDQQIATVRGDTDKTVEDANQDRTAKGEQLAGIEADRDKERTAAQEAAQKLQVQVTERDATIKERDEQIKVLQQRLGINRAKTDDALIRQIDGHLVRIPGSGHVYVDLGYGNQVAPGLTFEVYDKNEGIPKLGDSSTDEQLPEGKASIEITRVGATSSEARIIKQKLGTQLMEGDLIVNLVYDPKVKYNFVVHGNFDMDNNGVVTSTDADIIKRLITQWGGKVMDNVTVDTDFVVMGKEPEVKPLTPEQESDPIEKQRHEEEVRAAERYAEVRDRAAQLHVPILNQNRFLYYVGYYDLAKR
jgi:hypothetical protein